MPTITIDTRMINSSGIGTYIRNLVPKIISAFPDVKFNLLGNRQDIIQYQWSHVENVDILNCLSPIYSIAEQIGLSQKIPKDTTLFWSPHYNIPLLYHGTLMVTVHDVFHLAMPQFVKGWHKRLYAKGMFSALKHKADAIICISHFTADELQRLTGINSGKIKIIHNGISETWFNIEKKERPHSNHYLLYAGNVKPHKNLARLIEAFKSLAGKIPHDFVIVGKKEGFITGDVVVEKKAAELGNRVHFTGYVDEDLLKQYVVHSDAMVFPSLYEGFGLPPLEAMACGCPVVVSNAASLPEVCGDAAYYVDPYNVESIAEGIYKVLTDETLRQSLIQKGIERAKLFSWEKSAKEYISVFEEVLNS